MKALKDMTIDYFFESQLYFLYIYDLFHEQKMLKTS